REPTERSAYKLIGEIIKLSRFRIKQFSCLIALIAATAMSACLANPSQPAQDSSDCWKPILAGFWYDKEAPKLRAALVNMLEAASRDAKFHTSLDSTVQAENQSGGKAFAINGRIVAAIVPHASYEYSGLTAA